MPTDGTRLPIVSSGDFGVSPFLRQLSGKHSAWPHHTVHSFVNRYRAKQHTLSFKLGQPWNLVGVVRPQACLGSIAPEPASAVLQRSDAIAPNRTWIQELDQRHPSATATTYCLDRFPGTLRPLSRHAITLSPYCHRRLCRRARDPELPADRLPRRAICPRPDQLGVIGFEPAQP